MLEWSNTVLLQKNVNSLHLPSPPYRSMSRHKSNECAHLYSGGQWKTAISTFEVMRGRGCKPDGHAHGSLIAALASGGQWQGCLTAFTRMQVPATTPCLNFMYELVGQTPHA